MSVDTYIGKRNISQYQLIRQDGVELLVAPGLARQASNLSIDLKKFLFFNHLKAVVEFSNGIVLGARRALS